MLTQNVIEIIGIPKYFVFFQNSIEAKLGLNLIDYKVEHVTIKTVLFIF